MIKVGIHISNGPIDYADLDRMMRVGARHYTLLHLQAPYLPHLRAATDGTLLVRYYATGVLTRNAYDYAREVATAAQQWSSWTKDVVFANELALSAEGGPGSDDPRRVAEWCLAVADYVRAIDPTLIIHMPALSPVGNWWGYYQEMMRYQGHYDVIDLHAYGTLGEMSGIVRAAKSQTGKQLFVSELNGPGTMDFLQWIESDPQVIGGTYFIWYWAEPDLPGWDQDMRGSRLEQEMTEYSGNGGTMPNWEFSLGFAEYARVHPEVGTPTSDLQYDVSGNGWQFTTAGMLIWNRQGNQVQFFRRSP